ncbi:MAG: LysR family transcriptional regulator [Polyangiaceae bacterium]
MTGSPLASLDANLLVVLQALLTERSVAKAARRVGLSPSAASHALARAREVFDDPLLIRAGRALALTPRAEELEPFLREGVASFARAFERPAKLDLGTIERTIRIAAVDYAQLHWVRDLALSLRAAAPRLTVASMPFTEPTWAALRAGEVELALGPDKAPKAALQGLRISKLGRVSFACCIREGHPALAKPLTAARFAALQHVLVSPRGRVSGAVDAALGKRGLKRVVSLTVPTVLSASLVVAESDLVLTCAEESARLMASWLPIRVFAPPIRLEPFTLALVWHPRTEGDPLLDHVRARILERAKRPIGP